MPGHRAPPTIRATMQQTAPMITWRSHLSLALLGLVYIFSYVDRQAIAVLIEPIRKEFGASDTQMGLLTGLAFGVMYAGLGIPMGRLADRGRRNRIVAVCCALWSLATMACGMAQQFWQLLLARMSVAVGEAGGMAPSIALVSDLYPPRHRSLVISLFMMGPHLGVIVGLALGGWIAQTQGWRATFLWFGAPGVLLGALVWWWVKEPPRGGFDAAPRAPASTEPLLAQLRRLLAQPSLRWVALACGVAGVSGYGYGVWMPSFLVRTHGLSIAHAGLVFGLASGLGAVAGAFFSGWLCDRLVQRDARWQLRLPMLGVSLAIPIVLGLLAWPAGGHWQLGTVSVPYPMALALAFGFFASWWPSLSYSAVSQMVAPHERGTAAAILNLFITLFGVGAGPLVTGMISDALRPRYGAESLRYALACAMALMVFTVWFYGLAMRPYRERLAQLQQGSP